MLTVDLSLLRPVLCGGWQDHIEGAQVWLSGGGTQSVLHSDGMENINCMLDGRKQIIMMDKVSLHWADPNKKVFFLVRESFLSREACIIKTSAVRNSWVDQCECRYEYFHVECNNIQYY